MHFPLPTLTSWLTEVRDIEPVLDKDGCIRTDPAAVQMIIKCVGHPDPKAPAEILLDDGRRMAAGTHFSVYVRLLDEGTRVFRPTKAVPVEQNVVRLLEPANYDPQDEIWEFQPGSLVHIEQRTLDGTIVYVAVSSIA